MTGFGTKTGRLAALLLVLAASAAAGAACGGHDDAGAGATPTQTTTQTTSTPTPSGDRGWERVVPGGGCRCSDGSEFSFWVRAGNPRKVVFHLQGGGACFSAETCAPAGGFYRTMVEARPMEEGGIFDFADERNPFADHSVVYVPYCTGDAHLGTATRKYARGLTVQHRGYVNGSAALDHLTAVFPASTDVVVTGESAGSIAAPLYAGLISDRLPEAHITVVADGSGSYPDAPRIGEIFATWGFGAAIPAWPENAGLGVEQWSPTALFVQSGRHDPTIVFARHDYAYDENQESWYPYLGIAGKSPLSLMDANEARIERAGVNLVSYTAPGNEHTVIGDGPLYGEVVDGVRLVDWLTRLVEGEPVRDVHCRKCRAGSG